MLLIVIISKRFYLLLKNRLCICWRASYLFLHYVFKESGKQMKRKRKRNEHERAKREIYTKRTKRERNRRQVGAMLVTW